MANDDADAGAGPVDLLLPAGSGPLWGMASADLNATLLSWPPGHEVPSRRVAAGGSGVRYLSIHRRRGPLQIQPLG